MFAKTWNLLGMNSILELFSLLRSVQFPIIYSMYVGLIVDLGERCMRRWDERRGSNVNIGIRFSCFLGESSWEILLTMIECMLPWKLTAGHLKITHLQRKIIWPKPPLNCVQNIVRVRVDVWTSCELWLGLRLNLLLTWFSRVYLNTSISSWLSWAFNLWNRHPKQLPP